MPEIGKENSVLRCLVAVQAHSPARYERKMAEQIPALTDRLPDPDLKRVLRLFRVDRRCWDWLTEPLRIRLRRVIETYTYDAGDSDYVFEGLVIDDLRPVLLRVFAALRDDYKMVLISRNPRQEFVAEGIRLYEEIGSWRQAELVAANVIMPLTPYLTAADVERIAQAIINVHDIRTAHASPELVSRIFQETPHLRASTQATWGELLRQLNERGQAFTALRTALTEAGVPLPPA
jgi:hypothetical protein